MSRYRRARQPGGTYFFTVVTFRRRPLFADPEAGALLRAPFRDACIAQPFRIDAVCLLPDHLHAVWTLPDGDSDFSTRSGRIKGRFSHDYVAEGGQAHQSGASRARRGEVGVWQRRFWEYLITDDEDSGWDVDYIHYNPVKHGHVTRAAEWPWSSFHRHVRAGLYAPDWGAREPETIAGLDRERE